MVKTYIKRGNLCSTRLSKVRRFHSGSFKHSKKTTGSLSNDTSSESSTLIVGQSPDQ